MRSKTVNACSSSAGATPGVGMGARLLYWCLSGKRTRVHRIILLATTFTSQLVHTGTTRLYILRAQDGVPLLSCTLVEIA